jgi:hypothetical protein
MARMNNVKWLMLFALLPALGCAPLQQAPLVYASKVSVGVDLSATTTEQPGVSINIGVKVIDAAYVPVAVAKPCDKDAPGSATDCTKNIYKMVSIAGSTGDSGMAEQDIQRAKERIRKYTELVDTLKGAQADSKKKKDELTVLQTDLADTQNKLEDTQNKLADVEQRISKVNTDKSVIEKRKPIDTDETKNLDAQLTALSKEKEALTTKKAEQLAHKRETEGKLPAADSASKFASAMAEKADIGLQEQAKELPSIMNDIRLIETAKRSDAYSVFGSFDTSTKAGAEAGGTAPVKGEASLALGKVFSTGVASQQLTEGLKGYYQGAGKALISRAACVEGVADSSALYKTTLDMNTNEGKKSLADFMNNYISACNKPGNSAAAPASAPAPAPAAVPASTPPSASAAAPAPAPVPVPK